MPLPVPKTGESSEIFISRCMSDDLMGEEYPDSKQRLAICFSQYKGKEKEMKKGFITIAVDTKKKIDTETRDIVVSERLGVTALYSFNRKKILKYYFDEKKDWTEDKANEWYKDFKETKVQSDEKAKKFIKMDEEKRIVYGVVYAPFEVDLQGDMMTPEAIEDMEHNFMKDYQNIDEMHAKEGMGIILESYIAPVDFVMNEVKVTEGSWVLVTEASDEVWKKIKNGELVGYSIGYEGEREEIIS